MAARKPRVAPLEELPPDLVERVAGEVRATGALLLTKLTSVKLTGHVQAELQEKLIRGGLERTGKHMRVPVEEQLAALLRESALVIVSGLTKKVKGSNLTEIKKAAAKLVRRGEARFVVVGGKDHLALPSDDQLEPAELKALNAALAALTKTLKKVAPKQGQPPKTLLRGELGARLEAVVSAVGRAPAKAIVHPDSPPAPRELVFQVLAELEEQDPLVYVPELVRSLANELTPEQVLNVLSQASHDGLVELRPESGIRTLGPEDALLCLPGPQGTLLSYVRRAARGGGSV